MLGESFRESQIGETAAKEGENLVYIRPAGPARAAEFDGIESLDDLRNKCTREGSKGISSAWLIR